MPLFQLFTTARSKLDTNIPASPVDPSPVPESDYVELVWENGQILAQGQSQSNRARRSGFNPSVSQPSYWSEAESRHKTGKLSGLDFGLSELSSLPSGEISLGQDDDDVVPWLSYPFNGSLQSDDFSSDLLPELPGIAGVEDGGEVTVSRSGPTQSSDLNPSSSVVPQQRLPLSTFRSRFLEDAGKVKVMATEDQGKADQGSAFSSFPCFSSPATLFGPDTDDPTSCFSSLADPVDFNFASSSGMKQSENKQDVGTIIVEVSDVLRDRNEAENGKVWGRTGCSVIDAGGNTAKGERDGCNPKLWLKRKSHDNDEFDAPSEDVDEEPVRMKEQVPFSRGTASKRSRAAEVHNLSERRRRDRINEKMRTLQELIPNCNKTDKASILDEAIEYLKMLRLQVQMMTMGTGMSIPPMMLRTGIHNMPHFPHMGLGLGPRIDYGGMGLNAGNSVTHRPVVHIPPPVHGGHFPTMHHGMLPGAFGYTEHGIPMSIPRTPFHPLSATSVTSGYGMAPTTTVSSSKETGPRTTTPTNPNSSCPGDQPPTQSGQMRNSSKTSDANAADSGGPT